MSSANRDLFNPEHAHPELAAGEVFFINSNLAAFEAMIFQTKRKGKRTFNGNGVEYFSADKFPVFVLESELSALNLSVADARKKHLPRR